MEYFFACFCTACCLLGRVMLWRSAARSYALSLLMRRLGGLVQLTDELGQQEVPREALYGAACASKCAWSLDALRCSGERMC